MTDTATRQRRSASRPGIARHGRLRESRTWVGVVKLLAAIVAVLAVSTTAVVVYAGTKLVNDIDVIALEGEEQGAPLPQIGDFEGGVNLLLVGTDTREGQGDIGGGIETGNLNDVNMLVHISADHTNMTVVSIPRDLVVPIPSCPRESGTGYYSAMSGRPINETLGYGGLPCTVLTVEELTGLEIPFAAMVTFTGVIGMSDAVGGVPVCITGGDIADRYTETYLSEGEHTLSGAAALEFLRTRHGVGDGSDLGRISSQQAFLSSLVRTITGDGTLNDPTKLYGLASAATQNMTLSSGLAQVNTMVSIAQTLRGMDLNNINFVRYPSTFGSSGVYAGKLQPIVSEADELMDRLANDIPFALGENSVGVGAEVVDPGAPEGEEQAGPEQSPPPTEAADDGGTPAPVETDSTVIEGLVGQSAAQQTCSVAN